MPWSNNNGGGPWGGGGNQGGGGRGPWGSGGGPGDPGRNPQDFDRILKEGSDRLKHALGGRGSGQARRPGFPWWLLLVAAVVFWLYQSLFQVQTDEQAVIMTFGKYDRTIGEGLGFAAWPVQTYIKEAVTSEQNISIGSETSRKQPLRYEGLMLTGDENIVDVNFQIVWNISDLERFLFNLAKPNETIQAVSESVIREVIGKSKLQPILTTDRPLIEAELETLIQETLDSYGAGVNIVRVNFGRADPPFEVVDDFRSVQEAEQERAEKIEVARKERNRLLADARGEAAQKLEDARAYAAEQVNTADGEAQRFVSIYDEYKKAPEVTRKRLYLETIERVYKDVNKIILDEGASGSNGSGVVPYLPLNELTRQGANR